LLNCLKMLLSKYGGWYQYCNLLTIHNRLKCSP